MRILSFIALCTFMMAGISVAQENQKFTTKSYVDILPELILMESFSSVEGSHIVSFLDMRRNKQNKARNDE